MHQAACVYDWCYYSLEDAEKKQFVDHFIRLANGKDGGGFPIDRNAAESLVGHPAHGSYLGNQLAAGLAIFDEEPAMFEGVLPLIAEDYADAAKFLFAGGADLSGLHYARHINFAQAVLLLGKIGLANPFGEGLARMPYEWIYMLRPDGRMLRSGDTPDDEGNGRKHRYTFSLLGGLFDDPLLLHMGEWDIRDAPPEQPHQIKYRLYDRMAPEELVLRFIAVTPEAKTAWSRSEP
jgi:hypothetical protein